MKKQIVLFIVMGIIVSLITAAHAAAFSETYPELTALRDTKVYSTPTLRSSVTTSIPEGLQLTVLHSSRYYHYVSLKDGRHGWVRKKHSAVRDIHLQTAETLTFISAKQSSTNVYEGPGIRYKSISAVKKGEEYPVLAVSKYYYKIQMLEGKTGWISKKKAELIKKPRLIMGWNYLGTTDTFIRQAGGAQTLDVVTPRWFRLKNTAPYVDASPDSRYVEWAHKEGKQIWAMLGNKFDTALTYDVLSDESKRRLLAQSVADYIIESRLDGVNVDFENMDIRNKEHFVSFVRQLKDLLSPAGKIVSVDVTRENPDPFWSGCYDRRGLGEAADYVIMMGYDEHWSGGAKAGSNASEPWTREGVRLLLNEVPGHKVLLGVPFYTKLWVTDNEGKVTGKDLSMPEVQKLIRDKNLTPVWDEKTSQHYVEYHENGQKFQIWVEDRRSMEWRWGLVHEYRLGGVAAWAVGMETPDIWTVFSG